MCISIPKDLLVTCIFVILFILGQLWCLGKTHLSLTNRAKCARNSKFGQQTCFSITKSIEEEIIFFCIFSRFPSKNAFFQHLSQQATLGKPKYASYVCVPCKKHRMWCAFDVTLKNVTPAQISGATDFFTSFSAVFRPKMC